jgi:hypothetical protein
MSHTLYIIYRASHPTAGSYVGLSTTSLTCRRSAHVTATKRGSKIPFHCALRNTQFKGWLWERLGVHFEKVEAEAAEVGAIRSLKPTLNVRSGGAGGGNWPAHHPHGGWKNLGKTASPEVKAWFRKFHSERPRKRTHDRQEMRRLFREEGLNFSEIARRLACDAALVSRVLRGEYKS